ncbi:MAG: ABC transporter substrate-binding protein [Bacilli bacterium]
MTLSTLFAGFGGFGGAFAATAHRAPVTNGGTMVQTFPTAFGLNFIPFLTTSYYTFQASAYSFDSILRFNRKDQLVADIVNNWSVSPNKLTYTFQINPKARWSNGAYITTADVKLGVDWLLSTSYNKTDGGAYGYLLSDVVGVPKSGYLPDGQTPSGFKVLGPREFSVTLQHADAAALPTGLGGITPLPSFILGKIPMSKWKGSAFDLHPSVGSGPFITTSVVPGQSITQKANPYYVLGRPHIAQNVWKVVSPDVVNGDLASGQVTIAGIHGVDAAQMKKVPNLNLNVVPTNGFDYLGWRLNNATFGSVFSQVKFRQAVEYALNRPAMIKALYAGYGTVENGPLPPINFWYNKALNGTYAYNPAKANALLNSIGMKIKNGWRTTPNGQPFTPALTISSGNSTIQRQADFVQHFLQAVHINLKINPPINFNTMLSQLNSDANGKQPIQAFLMAWSLGNDPDPRGLWRSTDNLNLTSIDWTNPKDPAIVLNDKLIHESHSMAAYNINYRIATLNKWQALLNQQMPENFLFDQSTVTAYNKNLHGVVFTPYGLLDPQQWWLSTGK